MESGTERHEQMLTLSIALLFCVAAVSAALVLAQTIALALPAWIETKAAMDACPDCREALVRHEYRIERRPLPKGRPVAPRPLPATRRALRPAPLTAAA